MITDVKSLSQEEIDEIQKKQKGEKEKKGNGKTQARYFCAILYPFENENHKNCIEYLKNHQKVFNFCAIYHEGEMHEVEKDIDTDDANSNEIKMVKGKDHCHIIVDNLKPIGIQGFKKFFQYHVEPNLWKVCQYPEHYIYYMIHDTPASIADGKKPYSVEDIFGTDTFIVRLMNTDKTQILYQMKERIFNLLNEGFSLIEIYEILFINESKSNRMIFEEAWKSMQNTFLHISSQELQLRSLNRQNRDRENVVSTKLIRELFKEIEKTEDCEIVKAIK